MSRLPFEAFLAFRYLRPRRTFVSVITVISIIGVLLGVAVLIVVIAVMSGFDNDWRVHILGFNAHLKVLPSERGQCISNYPALMKTIYRNPNVIGASPFIGGQVLIKTEPANGDSQTVAPLLLGVDPDTVGKVNVVPKSIIAGSFDLQDQGLVIGRELAAQLELDLGDHVAIYSKSSIDKMVATLGKTNAEVFLADDFTVRGIFNVDFPSYNESYVIISLEDARQLQDLPENSAQWLQVQLRDPMQADAVAEQLRPVVGNGLFVETWREANPAIFGALAVEKNMMFYLLFFIVIVAAFGIVNCQITFVVQKTREIGILKALGGTQWQILWIFLSQSIAVGVFGVGLGLGTALLALRYRNEFLTFMRNVTHMPLLPADIYNAYDLPASIQPMDLAIICGTAFVTCVLAGLFPAWKASRLQPVEALRHE